MGSSKSTSMRQLSASVENTMRMEGGSGKTRYFLSGIACGLVLAVFIQYGQVTTEVKRFVEHASFKSEGARNKAEIYTGALRRREELSSQAAASSDDHERRVDIGNDPCLGRPTPAVLDRSSPRPPSLFFLHIPKTAGTLMHHLVIQYAQRTKGNACQYLYDGNRFGPEHYALSAQSLEAHANDSIEQEVVDAIGKKDHARKLTLLAQGGCRTMRGHVTYRQRQFLPNETISLTVLRNPIERLISMYEFVMMMIRTRPGKSGWDHLVSGSFETDFGNSSSLLHKGFYDETGTWIARHNIGFSFHFYGVLHQLSGITPVFENPGNISAFRIANSEGMAEKAKDNICTTHILGVQDDMDGTLSSFFETLAPYANWSDDEKARAKLSSVNKNHNKTRVPVGDYLSEPTLKQLQRRLYHEIQVFDFALRVIAYRRATRSRKT